MSVYLFMKIRKVTGRSLQDKKKAVLCAVRAIRSRKNWKRNISPRYIAWFYFTVLRSNVSCESMHCFAHRIEKADLLRNLYSLKLSHIAFRYVDENFYLQQDACFLLDHCTINVVVIFNSLVLFQPGLCSPENMETVYLP